MTGNERVCRGQRRSLPGGDCVLVLVVAADPADRDREVVLVAATLRLYRFSHPLMCLSASPRRTFLPPWGEGDADAPAGRY